MKKLLLILVVIILGISLYFVHYKKPTTEGIVSIEKIPFATTTPKTKNVYPGILTGRVTLDSKPYAVLVDISAAKFFMEVHSDVNGIFLLRLYPGVYTLRANTSGALYPRCESKQVVIKEFATTTENLFCDTGIR